MKKVYLMLAVLTFGFGLVMGNAEAKRLGGGKSTGMQRESVTQRQPAAPANTPTYASPASPGTAAAPPPAPAPKRNWLGPLAGLAAGLGLAALFSHFGLGAELGSALMIGLLVLAAVIVIKLLFRRREPAEPMQYAGAGGRTGYGTPAAVNDGVAIPAFPPSADGNAVADTSPAVSNLPSTIPPSFDREGFLRVAKLNFIRLQAANDAGNLEDIREFVSPELFAEIRLQLTERGSVSQQTDVVTLNAELVELTTEGNRHIASVRFNGMIREEAGTAAVPFDEVWHLTKPVDDSKGWIVAGIQQLA